MCFDLKSVGTWANEDPGELPDCLICVTVACGIMGECWSVSVWLMDERTSHCPLPSLTYFTSSFTVHEKLWTQATPPPPPHTHKTHTDTNTYKLIISAWCFSWRLWKTIKKHQRKKFSMFFDPANVRKAECVSPCGFAYLSVWVFTHTHVHMSLSLTSERRSTDRRPAARQAETRWCLPLCSCVPHQRRWVPRSRHVPNQNFGTTSD